MICHATLVTGRLTGPRTVELDEAVDVREARVHVLLLPNTAAGSATRLGDYLDSLPIRGVSREQLDRELELERGSWDDD